MVTSRLELIGGGPGTLRLLRRHLMAMLPAPPVGAKPIVAYVGAASGDDAGFLRMIASEIERTGYRVVPVRLASPKASLKAAEAVLDDCDVVFVSGGDVQLGMQVLADRGALPLFEALGREGRPMIGLSAGSIMLAKAWVRFPEDRDPGASPSLFPCLGMAPFFVDAHDEEGGWGELRAALRLVAMSGEPSAAGYGLTTGGGISVEPWGKRDAEGAKAVKVVPFGTAAPRWVTLGGKVVTRRPLALGRSEMVEAPNPRPPRRRAQRS